MYLSIDCDALDVYELFTLILHYTVRSLLVTNSTKKALFLHGHFQLFLGRHLK